MNNFRLEKFRENIISNGIDGALVYNDSNRNYLTGFTGNESYILVTQKDSIFITDSRYIEQAQAEVSNFEVRQYDNKFTDYIISLLNDLSIKNLGFEENHMTFNIYDDLSKGLQNVNFIKLNSMIERQRQIKDEKEIENIKKAAEITDCAFSHILDFIKSGMSENSIALELEFFIRSKGASKLSFTSIVASGKRSSLPHGAASDKIVETGDFLTLDFGCVYNGYCSDMTRTIVIGNATQKQKEIYSVVLDANEEALKFVKPGITGEDLDKIARKVIIDRGYGQYFGHGLGHGVGMDIHELPYVSKKGKEPLEAGMVITDEPGIYIPDFGGVRIEDLVVVTLVGAKILSHSNKQLIELT